MMTLENMRLNAYEGVAGRGAPDQPDNLPSRCPNCGSFLPQYAAYRGIELNGWHWEADDVLRLVVWYCYCPKCGSTIKG